MTWHIVDTESRKKIPIQPLAEERLEKTTKEVEKLIMWTYKPRTQQP